MGKSVLPRVCLIHWNATEAQQRAEQLRAAGYEVVWELWVPASLRTLKEEAPAAVVIDLTRLPSHGRDVALTIRRQASTRHLPLVFVGGDAEKVARTRALLPDACYTPWSEIAAALPAAISQPVMHPVVPRSTLAGYSGTPLPKKLGIKAGSVVGLIGAPAELEATLGELPPDVSFHRDTSTGCDLLLWFPADREELERRVEEIGAAAGPGGLWIAWPKKASGVATDVSETIVRRTGLAAGLVDYKIAAIDATWSGLRFTRRKSGG